MKWLRQFTISNWQYIAVTAAVALVWFFEPGYIFLTDFVWGPNMKASWTEQQFLLVSLVNLLGFVLPVSFLQKVFVTFAVGMTLAAGKKLGRFFLRDKKWLVFIVSLFVLFNPFVYDRFLYGQMGVVLSYALMVHGFASFLFAARKDVHTIKHKREAVMGSIAFAFALQFSPHFIFMLVPICAVLFVHFMAHQFRLVDIVKGFVVFSLILLVLNINWVGAIAAGVSQTNSFVNEGITEQDLNAFAVSGGTDAEAVGNVAMMSGFWGKDQFRYQDLTALSELWGKSFFILLPIVLLGLYYGLKRRGGGADENAKERPLTFAILIAGFVAFVLALGIKAGFADGITYWLFEHMPFYKGLRDTQKWVAVVVLMHAVFLALGLRRLFEFKFVDRHRVSIAVFCMAVAIMQAPILLFGFWGQAEPRQYPNSWKALDQSIVTNDVGERDCESAGTTLFLPWHLYLNLHFVGTVAANPAPVFFSCKTISGTNMEWAGIYDNSRNETGAKISEWIFAKGADGAEKLKGLDVRRIVLAKEVDWQAYAWIDSLDYVSLAEENEHYKLYEITH